jgi:hypothetical protein
MNLHMQGHRGRVLELRLGVKVKRFPIFSFHYLLMKHVLNIHLI